MRTLWPMLGLLLAVIGAAPASGGELSLVPLRRVADEERMPLARVLGQIADQIPGRALDVTLRERKERATYRVKWLGDDGKVREITADAHSGKIIKVR
jgi:uncharacterized membrane protein YkoI